MVLNKQSLPTFKENLNVGEQIVVQIVKEQISKKGPTVTRNINIEDEYLIAYLYNTNFSSIDKKYKYTDKKYLQTIVKLIKPNNLGLEIKETEKKINLWNLIYKLQQLKIRSILIKQKIKNSQDSPCLISSEQRIADIILKKNFIRENTIILFESKTKAMEFRERLFSTKSKKHKIHIEYCKKKISNNYQLYVEHLIKQALKSNIKLANGGHIIIEKTEALTSIDVNSGSFNKLKSSRETILWINLAAAKEIIYQLQVKNISGIIVIDFIVMINQNDQLSLLEYLDRQLQSNLNSSQIIQISEIGLVEITRQREERNIYDMFAKQCLECKGIGYLRQKEVSNKLTTYFLETSPIYG